MNTRIKQLDSLRGLAAITVFLHHIYLVMPFLPVVFIFSPLKFLVNGDAAVILFFVLSGFVLYIPFSNGEQQPYFRFIIKRILRIYVPYLVCIILVMIFYKIFSRGSIPELSFWFNKSWTHKINGSLLTEHLFFIGNIHSEYFNNAIWSLVHEMRISLFFPFIAYLVYRLNWKKIIFICIFLSFLTRLNELYLFEKSNGYFTTYFDSLHFSSLFFLGALLAKYNEELFIFYKKINQFLKLLLFVFAFFLYNYSENVIRFLRIPYMMHIAGNYLVAIASCIFILFSMFSTKTKKTLILRPLLFMGKISYSLYLYHLLVLLTMMHIFYQKIPLWMIYLLTLPIGFVIASLSYYLVEAPSIKLSKRLK
jgi:peptidoglycan/LPS O-acetylase OafA/YrhL